MRCWLVFTDYLYANRWSVINGSKRWIELGGINFQPSELAKLLMILYTSDYLVRRSKKFATIGRLLRLTLIAMGLILFIMLQPDFGSVVIIATCIVAMIFVGGTHAPVFIIMGAMFLAGTMAIMGASYRLKRVTSF